ncbi:SDR family oxidoreductase [Streptomyces sp. NPDC048002]|uniref:SDR family NAD(P)-dependent oxidoreductase n=1 Tax=Streptomyces sp. NPDC048002 TaxID=3154344 RepID=UPI0033EAF133
MPSIDFDFTGRVVIVTGAARGIGRELSSFFAAAGADVAMVDQDADALRGTAKEIKALPLAADVSRSDEVDAAVAACVDEFGRVDVLVNNAGVLRDGVLWKATDEDWDTVLAVHAGGAFRFTRACVPHFRFQQRGRIINVTSYTGLRGNVGQAAYATAKAGIVGFTKTAAKELAGFGITVNAISPNAETRMVASIPSGKLAELVQQIPMGRFAEPAEMCPAVGFLASDEAAYITGTVIPVDGGLSM